MSHQRHPASLRLVKAKINTRAGGISSLRNHFQMFSNGKDYLDTKSFTEALHEDGIDLPATEVSNLFDYIDTDHSGKMSFKEFAAAIDNSYNEKPPETVYAEDVVAVDPCFRDALVCKSAASLRVHLKRFLSRGSNAVKAFKTFVHRKGTNESESKIMLREFKAGLRSFDIQASDEAATALFKELDSQNDGYIDFGEFATAFFGTDAKKSLARTTDWVRQNKQAKARERQMIQMKALETQLENPFAVLKRKIQRGHGGTSLQVAFRRFKSTLCGKQDAVDFKGFQHALRELEIEVPADKAMKAFKKIDTDNSGIITFKEFRDSMYEKKNMVRTTVDWTLKQAREREEKLARYTDNASLIKDPATLYTVLRDMFAAKGRGQRQAFTKFMRRSGSTDALINVQEMKRALRINGIRCDTGVIERLFAHLDPDGDDEVNFTEFSKAFFDDDLSKVKNLNAPAIQRKKQRNQTPGQLTLDPAPVDTPAIRNLKTKLLTLSLGDIHAEFTEHKTVAFQSKLRDAVDLRGLRDCFVNLGVSVPIKILKQLFYEVDSNNRGYITFKQFTQTVGFKEATPATKKRMQRTSKKFPTLVKAPANFKPFRAARAATPQAPESPSIYFKRNMNDGMAAAFRNEVRRRKLVAASRARAKSPFAY